MQSSSPSGPRAGSKKYFKRGGAVKPAADDVVVGTKRKRRKMQMHDVFLRQFKYGDALNAALDTCDPITITSVIDELSIRKGLNVALANRPESDVSRILQLMLRYIIQPRFSRSLVTLGGVLCKLYGVSHSSPELIKSWSALNNRLKQELKLHAELGKVTGTISMLINASLSARDSANKQNNLTDLRFLDPAAEHSKGILLTPKQLESHPSLGGSLSAPEAP